jgi:hypothetical protein
VKPFRFHPAARKEFRDATFFLASRSFTTETIIHAEISIVRAALSNADEFIRLSPVVIAVERVPGISDTYDVTDRLYFMRIPYSFRYRVRMRFFDDIIDSEVWAPLQFHHVGQIRISSVTEGVLVREYVQMDAPRFLANYALRNAEQAHREMFSRLKRRIEGC